jgi:hypothetical protein
MKTLTNENFQRGAVALKPQTLDAALPLVTDEKNSDVPLPEGGFMCSRCAQQMDDCTCKQSAAYFL